MVAAGRPDDRGCNQPKREGDGSDAAKREKGSGIAELLRHEAGQYRTRGGPDALQRHDCAEPGIDVAGAGENARNETRRCHTEQTSADAVQDLNRHQAPRIRDVAAMTPRTGRATSASTNTIQY